MKSFADAFLKIAKNEKAILVWFFVNFVFSLPLFIVGILNLNSDSAVVKIGYGDIGGYRDGSWVDMLAFPILAVLFGILHSMIAVRIYTKKGAGMARIFLAISLAMIFVAFAILIRLVSEG